MNEIWQQRNKALAQNKCNFSFLSGASEMEAVDILNNIAPKNPKNGINLEACY